MFAKTSLAALRAASRRRVIPADATKRFMEYDNSPGKVSGGHRARGADIDMHRQTRGSARTRAGWCRRRTRTSVNGERESESERMG